MHGVESTLLAFVKTNVLMEIGVIETLPLQLSDSFVLPNPTRRLLAARCYILFGWVPSLLQRPCLQDSGSFWLKLQNKSCLIQMTQMLCLSSLQEIQWEEGKYEINFFDCKLQDFFFSLRSNLPHHQRIFGNIHRTTGTRVTSTLDQRFARNGRWSRLTTTSQPTGPVGGYLPFQQKSVTTRWWWRWSRKPSPKCALFQQIMHGFQCWDIGSTVSLSWFCVPWKSKNIYGKTIFGSDEIKNGS